MATTDNSILNSRIHQNYNSVSVQDFGVPPSTNRGVTTFNAIASQASNHAALSYIVKNQKNQKTITVNEFLKPKFDWFEGRFSNTKYLDDVYPFLMPVLEGKYSEVWTSQADKKYSPVQRGYDQSVTFYTDDLDPFLSLHYGGQNGKYGVYFKTTGSYASSTMVLLANAYGITYETVRTAGSPIICTRVDVAVDFRMDNAKAFKIALNIAKKLGTKTDCAGSWTTKDPVIDDAGRTLYLKEANNCKIRLYEKAKEQIHKHGLEPGSLPLDWLRLEVQHNAPKQSSDQRRIWGYVFANITPDTVFAQTEGAVNLLNAFTGSNLNFDKIQTRVKKKPLGIDALLEYFLTTYHDKLLNIFDTHLAYEFFYRLYGKDYHDYPKILQSESMRQFLIELEYQNYGEF